MNAALACGVLAAALAVGCVRVATPPPVTRVVGGERRTGPFVSPYAYEQFIRGEMAFAAGDYEAAAAFFGEARLGPADDPLLAARHAEALEGMGAHERADAVLDEGLAADPHAEAIWLARARIAARRGALEEAIGAYERAARSAPLSPEAPLGLAALLERSGAPGRADAVLRRFLATAPEGSAPALRARLALAVRRGDARGIGRAVEALLEVAPAREGEARAAAEAAMAADDPRLAADVLALLPRQPGDQALRVRALLAAGRRDEAEGVLATAEDADVGGPVQAAELWLLAGRPERTRALLEVLPADARTPHVRLLLGRASLEAGQAVEAAVELSRVPPGATDHVEAMALLAEALRAGGLGEVAAEVARTGP